MDDKSGVKMHAICGDKTTKNRIRKCDAACVAIDVGTFSVGNL